MTLTSCPVTHTRTQHGCLSVCGSAVVQERLAMLKQQQEEAASRECTFRPVINHRSDRLMSERSEVLRVSTWNVSPGPSHHKCRTSSKRLMLGSEVLRLIMA